LDAITSRYECAAVDVNQHGYQLVGGEDRGWHRYVEIQTAPFVVCCGWKYRMVCWNRTYPEGRELR
jgi:hypothetical protein